MAPSLPNKQKHGGKRPKHPSTVKDTSRLTKNVDFPQPTKGKQSEGTPSTGLGRASQHRSILNKAPSYKATSSRAHTKPLSGAFDDIKNHISATKKLSPLSKMAAAEADDYCPRDCKNLCCRRPPPDTAGSARTLKRPHEGSSLAAAKIEEGSVTKRSRKHSNLNVHESLLQWIKRNMDSMPAEIQQMIWGYVIPTPACHTFKLIQDKEDGDLESKWSIALWPYSPARKDTSAYLVWKDFLGIKNSGLHAAFKHTLKPLKPIRLRVKPPPGKYNRMLKPRKKIAAIDKEQDLVIIDFERSVQKYYIFTWFEHVGHPDGLDTEKARTVLSPFHKVAILWGNTHCLCGPMAGNERVLPAPFYCYCHIGQPNPHHFYKACPIELSCFLDLFRNLEQFYIVVVPKGKVQERWLEAYRSKVIEQNFEAVRPMARFLPNEPLRFRKQTLARFSDEKYEYLQQAQRTFLQAWDMTSPWAGAGSVLECLTETMARYQGKEGSDQFCQSAEKRKEVHFSILIRSPLPPPPEEQVKFSVPINTPKLQQAKLPVANKQTAQPAQPAQPVGQSAYIRRALERARAKN